MLGWKVLEMRPAKLVTWFISCHRKLLLSLGKSSEDSTVRLEKPHLFVNKTLMFMILGRSFLQLDFSTVTLASDAFGVLAYVTAGQGLNILC